MAAAGLGQWPGFTIHYILLLLGQSSSLVCKVENGNDYPIIWMKNIGENSTPLSTGKNLILDNPRFDLRYNSQLV